MKSAALYNIESFEIVDTKGDDVAGTETEVKSYLQCLYDVIERLGYNRCFGIDRMIFSYISCAVICRHRKMTFILIGWAVANCYTRIYMGVHYPGDIMAGVLIGSKRQTLAYSFDSAHAYLFCHRCGGVMSLAASPERWPEEMMIPVLRIFVNFA